MDNSELKIEDLSAEIHKCYCRYYLKRFGKEYHTNGDYSKLDEATKDADREMAKWVTKNFHNITLAQILAALPEKINDKVQFIHEDSVEDTDIVIQSAESWNAAIDQAEKNLRELYEKI